MYCSIKRRETLKVSIFTACKRSLGQGNIFTGICLSTGGGGLPGRDPLRTETPFEQIPLRTEIPQTETSPTEQRLPWTETPSTRRPPDRDPWIETLPLYRDPPPPGRGPLDREPLDRDPLVR